MARLIWAVTALALAALVSGFFVDTTTAPLFASIGLSAVVMVLILAGWSRRIRRDLAEDGSLRSADDSAPKVVEVEPDVDEEEIEEEIEPETVSARRPRPVVQGFTSPRPVRGPSDDDEAFRPAPPRKRASRTRGAGKPAAAAAAKAEPSRAGRTTGKTAGKTAGKKVYVIPGREKYHAAGCRFAKGDDVREVSESTARKRGYERCAVCKV